jgi:hypothetical protein
MQHQDRSDEASYPLGRGYGHDYMRGGEVLGGYGYSDREEYARRRGDRVATNDASDGGDRQRTTDDAAGS